MARDGKTFGAGDSPRSLALMGATVALAEPTPQLRPGLLELELDPRDDPDWISAGAAMLPAAEADQTRHPVAIVHDGKPVGMFTLDWGARSRRYAAPEDVGLHGLLIDRRLRRQGFALAALQALPLFVRRRHPLASGVALTVNERNLPAIAVYRAAGFVDTGEHFLGGTSGPQHVMRLPLQRAMA